MWLAKNKILPPKEWEHNKYIKNIYDKTVNGYL